MTTLALNDFGTKRPTSPSSPTSPSDQALPPPPPAAQLKEYDPFALAKPCSPFYLYNHDSPRPSTDHKTKHSVQVSVQDLELGEPTLSPTVSQEKLQNQRAQPKNRFKFWQKPCSKINTGPKKKGRIARLPKKQRIMAKTAIALLIIGIMVGIALGIAAGTQSGVWKSNNQQRPINV